MKAIYKGKHKDRYSDSVDLVYEYRGHEYIVTDTHNGYAFNSLAKQHKRAQEEIDYKIEYPNAYEPSTNINKDVFDKWYSMMNE